MTSWRSDTSTSAQDDLDGLLNAVLEFADSQLQQGGFFPFAAGVDVGGDIEVIAVDPETLGSDNDADEIKQTCREAVGVRGSALRVAALVCDITLAEDSSSAVQVQLQHREGRALTVAMPYDRDATGEVFFGEMRASSGASTGLRAG